MVAGKRLTPGDVNGTLNLARVCYDRQLESDPPSVSAVLPAPEMPPVAARKLMASRSQQSSAKATRTLSPLSHFRITCAKVGDAKEA
jgi:hypothetical protein